MYKFIEKSHFSTKQEKNEISNFSEVCPAGFTLIEVLVALVVITIGLLGIIALQTNTLNSSHHAYLVSVTSIQASDLEERMRANPSVANIYVKAKKSASKIGTNIKNCSVAACNPKQLAMYDLYFKNQWLSTTYSLLPKSVTITLRKPSSATDCSKNNYELSFRLPKHKVDKNLALSLLTSSKPIFNYCFQLIS